MSAKLVRTVLAGLLGGAAIGLVAGGYAIVLTEIIVLHRDDFATPLAFEQTQNRFRLVLLAAFSVVFAVSGPYIAAGSYGPWLRDAIYGAVCGAMLVVGLTLFFAFVTNEQPFNQFVGSESRWIDRGRLYGVPAALLLGPLFGTIAGRRFRKSTLNAASRINDP